MVNIPIPLGPTIESAVRGLSTLNQNPTNPSGSAPIYRFPPVLGTTIQSVLNGAASNGITDAIAAAVQGQNILNGGLTGAGVGAAGVIMNQQQTYPYVQFQVIKYRQRYGIVDNKNASSNTDADTPEPTNANVSAGILDGVSTQCYICLPLPTDLQDAIAPLWDTHGLPIINQWQTAYDDIAQSLKTGTPMADKIINHAKNTGAIISSSLAKTLLGHKQVANPRKQVMFSGMEQRQFTFNYVLSPQSKQEAEIIGQIIAAFRLYSSPGVSPGGLMFDFPSEYLITFNQTAMFPKISSCVCTSVTTNYSSAAMQLLADGHPVQVGLTLTFTETDVKTQQDIGIDVDGTFNKGGP